MGAGNPHTHTHTSLCDLIQQHGCECVFTLVLCVRALSASLRAHVCVCVGSVVKYRGTKRDVFVLYIYMLGRARLSILFVEQMRVFVYRDDDDDHDDGKAAAAYVRLPALVHRVTSINGGCCWCAGAGAPERQAQG